MDIFGIGPLELILIIIIAILLFGPDKLPYIASKVGKMMRNINKATDEFNNIISNEIAQDKVNDKSEIPPEYKEIMEGTEQGSISNIEKNIK